MVLGDDQDELKEFEAELRELEGLASNAPQNERTAWRRLADKWLQFVLRKRRERGAKE